MVIMALDHTRDFLHLWSRDHQPTDLSVTTALLFFTRWITHFCAPAFVFLAGTSVAIQLKRSGDRRVTRAWVLRRGIILIVLECTIVNFALSFDPTFRLLIFEVIGTIGAGFILLSVLCRLPDRLLLFLTALVFFGHDLLPSSSGMALGASGTPVFWRLLRSVGWTLDVFQPAPGHLVTIAYPVIPWLGIMLAGFVAARWFDRPSSGRSRLFLIAGLASLALFVVLRFINGYGDPAPWSTGKNGLFTFLSFLNVTKYPPSLLFSLVTLAGLLLVLAAAEQRDNAITRTLLVYGRVPLFYFVIHLYLIHLILLVVVFAQGYSFSEISFGPGQYGRPAAGGGLPTWAIYPIWLGVTAALYPLCRWYGKYKSSHPEKTWLRYF